MNGHSPRPNLRAAAMALAAVALSASALVACSPTATTPGPGTGTSTSTGNSTGSTKAPATVPATAPRGTGRPGEGIEELSVALALVKRVYPAGSKEHATCLANRIQRQPDLLESAKQPLDQLDLEARLRLIDALADCIGPEVLWSLYEATHPIDPKQRECTVRLLSPNLALADAVRVVAGEPEAARKFEDLRNRECNATTSGPTTATTGAPATDSPTVPPIN